MGTLVNLGRFSRRRMLASSALGLGGLLAADTRHGFPRVAAARQTDTAGTPKRGGTITAALQNDWVSVDPLTSGGTLNPHHMIFEPLFNLQPGENGIWQPVPALVEEWEVSETTATLQLRQGVTYHDGSAWDAESLQWNVVRWMTDPESQAGSSLASILDTDNPVAVVDSHTATLNLTRPSAVLIEQLAGTRTRPVSRAAYEAMSPAEWTLNAVGAGPFQIDDNRPGDRLILKRFDNYWQQGEDGEALPYLDGITFRLIIDDSVRVLELQSGNIQLTELVPPKDIDTIKADPTLTYIQSTWSGNQAMVTFNETGGAFAGNVKLRQAALYAINREVIADILGEGIGIPGSYVLVPGSLGYDESLPHYTYDPERAMSLMAEAGFPDGLDVSFPIISRELDKSQAEILKQMWEQIGIRATIDVLERAAWVERVLGSSDFDVATFRTGGVATDPDVRYRGMFHSEGGSNYPKLENEELDDLIDRAASTYDPDERIELYEQIQSLDFELAHYNSLWIYPWNWVHSTTLKGFRPPLRIEWEVQDAWLEV
ncbi:MAG: ABC transporter substrate-binding protein [Chloroflexota bacterium]|nr:ABC transporter substrate-binding protein [Chloroflexota bacterium]